MAIRDALFGRPKRHTLPHSTRRVASRPIPLVQKGGIRKQQGLALIDSLRAGSQMVANDRMTKKKTKAEEAVVKKEEKKKNSRDDSSDAEEEVEEVKETKEEELFQVIEIHDRRVNQRGEEEYFVEWAPGTYHPSERLQWLPRSSLRCPELLRAYTRLHPRE